MMTLKEKVYEVGYNKEDNIRLFHLTDNDLLELHTDEDACVLVNCVVRPKSVEIWVVLGVVRDDETNDGEVEISADEGEGDSDWVKGDSADELDSECDGGSVCDGVEEAYGTINPKYISSELQFSGSEGEQSDGNLRCEGNVKETITNALLMASWQNQLGVEVPNQEEITIQTQPEYGSDFESIPIDIQIEHDDPAKETFEIPIELVHLSSNELPGKAISASQDKGKEVIASHHIARGKKSLGLTKSRKHCTKKYRTRSTTTFKSKFHGNVTAPVNID
nr:uncharacterized protein LOC109184816 [Ipomoea batatas]